MRKTLLMIVLAVAFVAVASADPLCTTAVIGAPNVLAGGFSCNQLGLDFSNFTASNAGLVPNPIVNLTMVTIVGNTVNLTFNPGLDATNGREDIYFNFMVSGTLLGVDLTNGGTGLTSIGETVCSAPLVNNACPAGATLLASFTAASQQTKAATFAAPSQVSYVFKDIFATADTETGTVSNAGHLSSFTESFDTPVPEPITFMLIGSGLLALGLIRRVRS